MTGDPPAQRPAGEIVAFPGTDREAAPTLSAAVEAMLFVSPEPLGLNALCDALGGADPAEVRMVIEHLMRRYQAPDRGIELVEVAGAFQLRTKAAFSSVVARIRGGKPQRLSGPALEVLSIIAYRQPVTRHEVDQIRGVDSGGPLRGLIDRGLVRVSGRRDEPGRPLEYATTPAFLELFGLPGLGSLPTLREREGLGTRTDSGDDPDPSG